MAESGDQAVAAVASGRGGTEILEGGTMILEERTETLEGSTEILEGKTETIDRTRTFKARTGTFEGRTETFVEIPIDAESDEDSEGSRDESRLLPQAAKQMKERAALLRKSPHPAKQISKAIDQRRPYAGERASRGDGPETVTAATTTTTTAAAASILDTTSSEVRDSSSTTPSTSSLSGVQTFFKKLWGRNADVEDQSSGMSRRGETQRGIRSRVHPSSVEEGIGDTESELSAASSSDVGTDRSDIATDRSDIATSGDDIATNRRDIATNRSDIAANPRDIAANRRCVAANRSDGATSRRGIALSALFAGSSSNLSLLSTTSSLKAASESGAGRSTLSAACRICQLNEDEADEELERTPCHCKGSLQFAHKTCVQKWIQTQRSTSCEICKGTLIDGETETNLENATTNGTSLMDRVTNRVLINLGVTDNQLTQAEMEEIRRQVGRHIQRTILNAAVCVLTVSIVVTCYVIVMTTHIEIGLPVLCALVLVTIACKEKLARLEIN